MSSRKSTTRAPGTKIILVRHGETDWNVIHRLQGVTDTKLTETGLKQAERVAARLAKVSDITKVYSSNLTRAFTTAKEIAKARGLWDIQIAVDDRLREFDLGMFAGHTHVSLIYYEIIYLGRTQRTKLIITCNRKKQKQSFH